VNPTPIDWHGRRRQPCPCGAGGPRDDALMVWVDDGNAFCHRCGETFFRDDKPLAPRQLHPVPPAQDELDAERRKRERAAAIWRASSAITPAAMVAPYFQAARGVPLPPPDGDLRYLPELRQFGFDGPALVGRMSLAMDYSQAQGLHITWLRKDGDIWRRAERRYLGPKKGCVIRLWPDEAVSTGLAIAEGVETALALAHAYRPTWACMDAGNLADFPVPPGIECLTIAADHDEAGIAAAEACAQRWHDAGREVFVIKAPTPRHDIADVAAQGATS
jgi:putative DNA primase/helicase